LLERQAILKCSPTFELASIELSSIDRTGGFGLQHGALNGLSQCMLRWIEVSLPIGLFFL